MKAKNIKDGTIFGYDVDENGERLVYFIKVDITGKGKGLATWNPDNKLRSYKSFKEALLYLAIAEETTVFKNSKAWVSYAYNEADHMKSVIIEARNEDEFYSM